MTVFARFKGRKEGFLLGVPARSLTQDEFDALDADQRRAVRDSDLYEIVEASPKAEMPEAPAPKAEPKREK